MTGAKGPTKCDCSCSDKFGPINPPVDVDGITLTFRIISEAKEVYAETGLTPREMMEERDIIIKNISDLRMKVPVPPKPISYENGENILNFIQNVFLPKVSFIVLSTEKKEAV